MQKSTTISAKAFGKVAVLMGGSSCEAEVSTMSGENVLAGLLKRNINAYPIRVGKDLIKELTEDRPDRVFNVLHGTYGEDGVVQGVLEILNIPYAGSGVAASALTMDKLRSNLFWQTFSLPVIPTMSLNRDTHLEDIVTKFDLPLCVKPNDSGSSYGISKITAINQVLQAYDYAKKFATDIIVQPWIKGREFTVGILGEEALPVIEIMPKGGFYDYEAKYVSESTEFICPCDLAASDQEYLQRIAMDAFNLAGCKHWGRVDFIRDENKKFWMLEVNTIPGMTTHSLVPKAALHAGIPFDELVWRILAFSL